MRGWGGAIFVLGAKRKNWRYGFSKLGYLEWKCANVVFQKMVRVPITKIGRDGPNDPWYQLDVLMPWYYGQKERTGDMDFQS